MLATTDVYLQRLVALREHGFPLAEQREREGRLNFGVYMHRCGTYGCLLGWWATTEYAQADGWALDGGVMPRWRKIADFRSDIADHSASEQYFGISSDDWLRLFGVGDGSCRSMGGTLADRRAYLDALIAERMQVTA